MPFKKTKFSTNPWFNKYLSNFDLLYKYKLKTLYKLPKIKKILLTLNFNKSLIIEGNKKNINSIQAQRILFFFFFSFFGTQPLVKINFFIASQGFLKENETDFNLKLYLLTDKQIENFLFFYFVEVFTNLKKSNYNFFYKTPFFFVQKNLTELNSKIPFFVLYNFNIFFKQITNKLILEESFFFISLKFKNLVCNNKKCVKNLPFF